MKELKKEDGTPGISTENLNLLKTLHGPVRFFIHHAPPGDPERDMTFVVFQDGFNHTALGFSSGYAGLKPRALHQAIQNLLKREDITEEHIAGWRGQNYMILAGKGRGDIIHNFAFGLPGPLGIIQPEKVMEVW